MLSVGFPQNGMKQITDWESLSSCAVNTHQTLTGCDLRCDFWCTPHQEVHGLASILTAMTTFKKPKRSILDGKFFNHWRILQSLAVKDYLGVEIYFH